MDTTNKCIDGLVKDIVDYKHSMEYTQAEVDQLKSMNSTSINVFKSISDKLIDH